MFTTTETKERSTFVAEAFVFTNRNGLNSSASSPKASFDFNTSSAYRNVTRPAYENKKLGDV